MRGWVRALGYLVLAAGARVVDLFAEMSDLTWSGGRSIKSNTLVVKIVHRNPILNDESLSVLRVTTPGPFHDCLPRLSGLPARAFDSLAPFLVLTWLPGSSPKCVGRTRTWHEGDL